MVRVISGLYKGRIIQSKQTHNLRPTQDRVKETLFAILGNIVGLTVVDLFAGTGNLGLEALSRGAEFCTFVEKDARHLQLIRNNVEALGVLERVEIVRGDVLHFLKQAPRADVYFADPPYRFPRIDDLLQNVLKLSKETLFVLETWKDFSVSAEISDRISGTRTIGETKLTFIRI